MQLPYSRRTFLEGATAGAVAGAWTSLANHLPAKAADEELSAPRQSEPIPTFTGIFPQHVALLLERSRLEHDRVADSLRRPEARPVTVAAYQMANHCGGEPGKQANLDHM